jgi:hypothetical protein
MLPRVHRAALSGQHMTDKKICVEHDGESRDGAGRLTFAHHGYREVVLVAVLLGW